MNSDEFIHRLFVLSRSADRFLEAHRRNPEAGSLKTLLDYVGVQAEELFKAGASLDDVARAAGVK